MKLLCSLLSWKIVLVHDTNMSRDSPMMLQARKRARSMRVGLFYILLLQKFCGLHMD